ncbi:MAG: nucleotidyltransferase [Clostridiales Family XIII bacterium]|jgi:predicted nucleotidyltransferase|nr:nucleotidyltransferase [Clostridiales Family XIII bacterium]
MEAQRPDVMGEDAGKVLGIVTEYNPFHDGHAYHLNEALRLTGAETTLAVMSGDFVQRGEPALLSKWVRADMAVRNGIDLVIELPFVYAAGNAEYFAKGAVKILNGLGCIDFLSFGSESGDASKLSAAAYLTAKSPEFNAKVKEYMAEGISYPAARHRALEALVGSSGAAVLNAPNDTLAVEYLKQMLQQRAIIKFIPVKRSENEDFRGATAIRDMLRRGDLKTAQKFIPAASRDIIKAAKGDERPLFLDDFMQLLCYRVAVSDRKSLSEVLSATEGLENRLADAVREAVDMSDLIDRVDTKRYTQTRIRRLILHTLAGLTKEDMRAINAGGTYARVLAFNDKGARLIRRMKGSGRLRIPIITNPNREQELLKGLETLSHFDALASDLRRIAETGSLSGFSDLQKNPKTV